MIRREHDSRGFTIIELMIATLVFSTILLLCATGLITIGRMYQKGNTGRATQEVARSVMDTIENDFELSGGGYKPFAFNADTNSVNAFCIGDNLYAYQLGRKRNPDNTGNAFVVISTAQGCALAGQGSQFPTNVSLDLIVALGGHELLGSNMRVASLTLAGSPSDADAQSLYIRLAVASGDDDLLNADGTCKGGAGQEWCGSSILETYATRRIQ